jgi:hypothetical protein
VEPWWAQVDLQWILKHEALPTSLPYNTYVGVGYSRWCCFILLLLRRRRRRLGLGLPQLLGLLLLLLLLLLGLGLPQLLGLLLLQRVRARSCHSHHRRRVGTSHQARSSLC